MLAAPVGMVAIFGFVFSILATTHESGHAYTSSLMHSTMQTACSSQAGVVETQFPLPSISAATSALYHDLPTTLNSITGDHPDSTVTTTLTSTYTMSTHNAQSGTPSKGYMDVVSEWRAKLDMEALIHDPELETNAMDTVVAGNGSRTHKLNPGTFGQVIAPGKLDTFSDVFVGGWLCEIPDLPGLGDTCASQSAGWMYNGQTGHAEILTSKEYSRIGCALYANVWCCDLA